MEQPCGKLEIKLNITEDEERACGKCPLTGCCLSIRRELRRQGEDIGELKERVDRLDRNTEQEAGSEAGPEQSCKTDAANREDNAFQRLKAGAANLKHAMSGRM